MKHTEYKGIGLSRQLLAVVFVAAVSASAQAAVGGAAASAAAASSGQVAAAAARQQVAAEQAPAADRLAATPPPPASTNGDRASADRPGLDTSNDPSENFNRAVFAFNEKVDMYFMKPVGTFYNQVIPKPLNMGIHNFFRNIDTIPTIVNDLLQLNIYQMANDLWRFGVNTTVGIVGLFDIATRINLPYYQNDFGLTMAAYGYEDSTYLVLPFWGSRTWRDALGMPVDYFAFSVYPYIYPERDRYALYGMSAVDARAQALKYQDLLEEAAIDKYVFMRDAYMQRRAHQIYENQHLGYDQRDDPRLNDPASASSNGA